MFERCAGVPVALIAAVLGGALLFPASADELSVDPGKEFQLAWPMWYSHEQPSPAKFLRAHAGVP